MNLAQLLILMLAMLLACVLGIHFSKYLGWWAMIPAYVIGAYLFLLNCGGIVRELRKSVRVIRERRRTGTGK